MKTSTLDEVRTLFAGPEILFGLQRAEEVFYDQVTTGGQRRELDRLIGESLAKIGIEAVTRECRRCAEYAHRLMRDHARLDPIEWPFLLGKIQQAIVLGHLLVRRGILPSVAEVPLAGQEFAELVFRLESTEARSIMDRSSALFQDRILALHAEAREGGPE